MARNRRQWKWVIAVISYKWVWVHFMQQEIRGFCAQEMNVIIRKQNMWHCQWDQLVGGICEGLENAFGRGNFRGCWWITGYWKPKAQAPLLCCTSICYLLLHGKYKIYSISWCIWPGRFQAECWKDHMA